MKINKKNKSCRKKEKSDLGAAILFLAPNFIGFLIFTLIPMVFSLVMSLYDWPLTGTHTFVGLKNFITLFTKDILFFKVMKNTFVYVIAYVALNVVIALGMAVWITSLKKANQFFRSVFFLPMMVGIVSSTMIFKWILNDTGIVNTVLRFFGAEGFNWFGSTKTAMIAVVIVSIWQGFGYNMVIFISGLLSVPKSLTEAAKIDGANSIQIFFKITLPYIMFIMGPYIITQFTGNINNFNVIYLLSAGKPTPVGQTAGKTDLLVTWLYKLTIDNQEYNIGAVIGILTFVVLSIVALVTYRNTKSYKDEEGFM